MPKLLCVFVITNIQVNLKHLKGQLDPPVYNVTFLDQLDQSGQLDPLVCNITFLDHQGGQFDPPVGNVEGQLGPQVSDASFVGTSVSNVMFF